MGRCECLNKAHNLHGLMNGIQQMARTELSDLADFVAVATHRSFRRAAVERGVSASALSHAIRSLEERLGVRLLNRTTRSVGLSEAGERLLARLRPALGDISDAVEEVNSFRDTPIGTLKLNVPRSAAPLIFSPIMTSFVETHPGMRLEIATDDRLVDIVGSGFDAGIRFGERVEQDMIAVRITRDVRFAVVGSPRYFKRRSMPRTPRDLRDHSCVRYRFPGGALYRWEFEKKGKAVEVDVDGPLTLDDQELMVEAAIGGAGLAFVFEDRAMPHLQAKRLMRTLDDWCPPFPGLFLYYPSRRQMPAGLRAFIDMMQARRQ
jgi:DNA-binding transcriptional LysR family regulator